MSTENTQGQINVVVEQPKKNGIGVAGLVLAIIALVFCWLPVLNWILWLVGLVLSFIGVFKKPKGAAIAGLVISLAGIILITVLLGSLAAAM